MANHPTGLAREHELLLAEPRYDEFSNFAQGLLINPGDYQLKIASAEGGQDHVEKITIKENQTTTIKVGSK